MGIRCADHVTPLYPQKLTLTSPTGGGGRSVGIVRSRTKATEFSFFIFYETESLHVINKSIYVLLMCMNLYCCMSDIQQILMYLRLLFLNRLSAVRKMLIYFFPLWRHHNFYLSSILPSVTGCWIWGSKPSGGEIFRILPDRPRGRSNHPYDGYQLSSPVIATGLWPSSLTPSNAEVKERVELNLY